MSKATAGRLDQVGRGYWGRRGVSVCRTTGVCRHARDRRDRARVSAGTGQPGFAYRVASARGAARPFSITPRAA